MKQGRVFFISGVTGTGKSTIITRLMERNTDWVRIKSYTTRLPRPEEIEHPERCSYHFVSQEKFQNMIDAEEFLEYAWVHDTAYYGTALHTIRETQKQGLVALKEIEVQGYQQVLQKLSQGEYYGIYLLPPEDTNLIIQRITKKGERDLSQIEINKRLQSIAMETEQSSVYNTTLISTEGELDKLTQQIEDIIHTQMHE